MSDSWTFLIVPAAVDFIQLIISVWVCPHIQSAGHQLFSPGQEQVWVTGVGRGEKAIGTVLTDKLRTFIQIFQDDFWNENKLFVNW